MTSPVAKIIDYDQRLRDNLLSQFHDDPVTNAMASVKALEIQRFENMAFDMITKTLLDNATGLILDWLGRIARVSRLGRTDDDYRKIIQVSIAARDSDGGAEQIIWIATQLIPGSVRYVQEGVANFTLQYFSDTALSAELQAEALQLIGLAVSAGVQWRLLASGETLQGEYDVDTFGAGRFGVRIGGS